METKDLGKSFGGNSFLFRHVDLKFPCVGFIGILGSSGSGKSTLMHLLSGLEEPSEGKVFLFGEDVAKMKTKRRRLLRSKDIAFLFQHYELLLDHSALENVMLPLLFSGERKKSAAKKAKSLLRNLGLEEQSHKKAELLSGGERQRVALARALAPSPRILFADEPTGALDSSSSLKVMEILKKVSEQSLVIMVSHNKELLSKYAQHLLYFQEEGLSIPSALKIGESELEQKRKEPRARKWQLSFLRRHLKDDWWKNGLSFFAGFLGFSALLLSLGFHFGAPASLEEETRKSLSFASALLTEKEEVEIEGSPLKLVRSSRPDETKAKSLVYEDDLLLKDDLGFFFPECQRIVSSFFEGSASFSPVWDLSLASFGQELLKEGEISHSFAEVYVNRPFLSRYPNCLHASISTEIAFCLSQGGISDEYLENWDFEIVGVVEEFSFLAEPTVYYSYPGLAERLQKISLPHISESLGTHMDPVLFLQSLGGSDVYGEDYLVFATSSSAAEELYDKIAACAKEDSSLRVESNAYTIASNYLTLCASFDEAMLLFTLISFVGVLLLLGMSGYSCYFFHKKEGAILRILGAEEDAVDSLYCDEAMLVSSFSAACALLLSPLLSKLVNALFCSRFGLTEMIRIPTSLFGIPYFVPALTILLALLLSFFAVKIPLLFSKKTPLAEEIRDE